VGWGATLASVSEIVSTPAWVAEDPVVHLLPHLEAAAAATGLLEIRRTTTAAEGEFVVELAWVGPPDADRRAIRTAVFAVVGAIGETITVVLEPPASDGRELEVLTGVLPSDDGFATHGHTIRLRVGLESRADRAAR